MHIDITKVIAWLKKTLTFVETRADKVAITVTEGLKAALDSGVADFVAKLIDAITKGGVAEEIVALLKKEIPNILAAELAIQGLPVNPTPDDILKFENEILAAFNVNSSKSKLWTSFSAQVYGIIQSTLQSNSDGNVTFAQWVIAVEEAYQDYLTDQQQAA